MVYLHGSGPVLYQIQTGFVSYNLFGVTESYLFNSIKFIYFNKLLVHHRISESCEANNIKNNQNVVGTLLS